MAKTEEKSSIDIKEANKARRIEISKKLAKAAEEYVKVNFTAKKKEKKGND